jgi:hypothetical protein
LIGGELSTATCSGGPWSPAAAMISIDSGSAAGGHRGRAIFLYGVFRNDCSSVDERRPPAGWSTVTFRA